MAISFIAEAHAPNYGTAYDTSPTCNKPTGTASGDLMIWVCGGTPSTPSGWTLLGSADSGTSSQLIVRVFYKVAGGAEPSSYTATCSNAWSNACCISTYRGQDTTTPIDNHWSIQAASGTNYNTASITAGGNQWLYSFACNYTFNGVTQTTPYTVNTGTRRVNFGATTVDPASAGFMSCDSNGDVGSGSISRTQTASISTSGGVKGILLINAATAGSANPVADNGDTTATAYNPKVAVGIPAGRAQVTAAAIQQQPLAGTVARAGVATVSVAVPDVGRNALPTRAAAVAALPGGHVYFGAPEYRIYHVGAETRTLIVAHESRVYLLPSDTQGS